MFKNIIRQLKRADWALLLPTFFLTAFGLIALYSIEATAEQPDFANFKKQLIFFGLGIAVMALLSVFDYRFLRTYGNILFIIGLIILTAVLILGSTINGTKGWFVFFGEQGFQPVELMKIFYIIFIGKLLSSWRAELTEWKKLLILCGSCGLGVILVLLQPDFGSAVILLAISAGMLLIAKVRKSFLVLLLLVVVVTSILGWRFVLQDYQKNRILTILDPSRDPYKSGYNLKQSIIAVGSGTFFGRGLGLGSQSRLNFLPAQRTDFIFAVIAEELGFIGAGLLILFYILLLYRLLKLARSARDDFGLLVAYGLAVYFFSQSILNIGMNIGLIPVAGVPLPFVSYGGSSLLVSFMAIGIAQSIYTRRVEQHYDAS